MKRPLLPAPSLRGVLATLFVIVAFHFGMEWLFFATKASFMHSFSRTGWLGSLLIPPAAVALGLTPLVLLLAGVDRVLRPLQSHLLVPAFAFASCAFLLIDNFTYTVYRFGVINSGDSVRFIYVGLFLLLWVQGFRWSRSSARRWDAVGNRHIRRLIPRLLAAAAIVAVVLELAATDFSLGRAEPTASRGEPRRPNIILLSSDGVEADKLSLYGYSLPTTPFLERLGESSLVFDNAFSNAGKTTGALSAMLSGLLPSELRVGFPPHIFPKEHALHHFPALLQELGYTSFQSTVRHYADAGDLNMLDSFDVANGRRLWYPTPGGLGSRLYYLFSEEIQFTSRMISRLVERLLHISAIKPIVNHYLLVTAGTDRAHAADRQSLEDALDFIRSQDGPYFAQIHLMGTHCCRYAGRHRWFDPAQLPGDLPQHSRRGRVAYLDAIRAADTHFQWFVERLEAEERLSDTLLVISSDHSQNWDSVERVPLVVRFPGGSPNGRVERNVSLVQVAPTILEFMAIERPAWMTAASLLSQRPPIDRLEASLTVDGAPPILSLVSFDYSRFRLRKGVLSMVDRPGPPLYGVKEVGLVSGPYWRKLDLRSGRMTSGRVSPPRTGTDPVAPPTAAAAREYIVRHLQRCGFTLAAEVTGAGADP